MSLSLSVRVNTVARRGRGGSGRGDVWSRQTEAAGVKQTETKPAVRGSDSGGGEREGRHLNSTVLEMEIAG